MRKWSFLALTLSFGALEFLLTTAGFVQVLWQNVRQKCRVDNRFFVRFLRQNFRISILKYSVIVASLCVGAILSVRQTVGSRQIVNVEL